MSSGWTAGVDIEWQSNGIWSANLTSKNQGFSFTSFLGWWDFCRFWICQRFCGCQAVCFHRLQKEIMATIPGPLTEAAVVLELPRSDRRDSASGTASHQFSCNLQVEYASEYLARIVLVTLSVDPELKPANVWREMAVEGRRLLIKFTATDARYLRASFSAFMDMLVLATRTIEEFGPGSQYKPNV